MLWEIKGADSQTGEDFSIEIEALNEADALYIAKGRGLFVSTIKRNNSDANIDKKSKSRISRICSSRIFWISLLVLTMMGGIGAWIVFKLPPENPFSNTPEGFKAFSEKYIQSLNRKWKNVPFPSDGSVLESEIVAGNISLRRAFRNVYEEVKESDPSDRLFYNFINNGEYEYNVEKTSSLVSPFVATITFNRIIKNDNVENTHVIDLHETLFFAWQDNRWVYRRAARTGKTYFVDKNDANGQVYYLKTIDGLMDEEDKDEIFKLVYDEVIRNHGKL